MQLSQGRMSWCATLATTQAMVQMVKQQLKNRCTEQSEAIHVQADNLIGNAEKLRDI